MKIKNSELLNLNDIYSQCVRAELDDAYFDLGYALTEDALTLEAVLKPFVTLRDKLQKQVNEVADTADKKAAITKANDELNNALSKEVTLELANKITKDFIVKNKIKVSGLQIKLLKDLKLMD